MQNYKLLLEYDGSKFSGWQRQPDARTVQEEIEKVFEQVLGYPVSVTASGRTDAGVHARGQVAHVQLEGETPEAADIFSFLQGMLPGDVVCHAVEKMPEDFHARYSAKLRTYSYTITQKKIAIGRMYAWHYATPLNLAEMQCAAEAILGAHDFTSFSKENPEIKNRVCNISHSVWSVSGKTYTYIISADRFVYSMIRALVGAMVNLGRGKLSCSDFITLLEKKDRLANKNSLAPPHGLCLEKVEY
ncbi:MAG TPA: tRNA pseudouridine(38-40) synthase TruA [Candidatus Kapabacteria bacterium]|nr:tRNA pseudouridine(38-40) synthase TruA [Candidatus Kapabacteria bacterium]